MIKNTLVNLVKINFILVGIYSSAVCSANENGLDPITKVQDADFVCGKVDGKFIVFSSAQQKVWYLFSDNVIDEVLQTAEGSSDLDGLKAYTYSLENNSYPLPTVKNQGGAALVAYKLSYGWSLSFLSVRKDSKGKLRLFKGEDGRNGICVFLN